MTAPFNAFEPELLFGILLLGYNVHSVVCSKSGWQTTVLQRGHFFSVSASITPHFTQYIYLPLVPVTFHGNGKTYFLKLGKKVPFQPRIFNVADKIDVNRVSV